MSGAASLTAMDLDVELQLGASDQAPTSGAKLARGASDEGATRAAESQRLRSMMTAHFSFIWRTLERLGVPRADVDDCAQQVFLVASRRLSAITIGSEQAFLFGTAMNVAAEARRTNARRRQVQRPEAEGAHGARYARDPGALPDELLDRARAREALDSVLASMPMDLRATFVLYELEELPIHRIAALLNVPLGTAATRLRRARAEFQRLVARLHTSGAFQGDRR